jgi:hypothetical protein
MIAVHDLGHSSTTIICELELLSSLCFSDGCLELELLKDDRLGTAWLLDGNDRVST